MVSAVAILPRLLLPGFGQGISRAMNDAPCQSLLEELDARQDELLDALDQLNVQIEQVLSQWAAFGGSKDERVSLPAAA